MTACYYETDEGYCWLPDGHEGCHDFADLAGLPDAPEWTL